MTSEHLVSVPRLRLLHSPGKNLNFKKIFRVRTRSKFDTGEITKPTGDNMKILREEPQKLTVLIFKKYTHIYSYIYT